MNSTGWLKGLRVTGDGTGIVFDYPAGRVTAEGERCPQLTRTG